MRIVANHSAYDTRAVRRVIQATSRAFAKRERPLPFWPRLHVRLLEGRSRSPQVTYESNGDLLINLPRLRGTEFIGLVRQQHGGDHEACDGLSSVSLALAIQVWLFHWAGKHPPWAANVLMDSGRMLKRIPMLIPLRIIKPEPPRDRLRDKLTRTMALKKSWQRKAKLAGTKLKKLARLQKRYEKQIAQRETST